MKKQLIFCLIPLFCSCSNLSQNHHWGSPKKAQYVPDFMREEIVEAPMSKSYYRRNTKKISRLSYQAAQEYVNRVGQKIALVSDEESDLEFVVTEDLNPSIYRKDNTILISRGLLVQLNSEAELAAVFSKILAKFKQKRRYGMAYTFKKSFNSSENDQKTMDYLYRAGYDPKASISATQKLNPQADTSKQKVLSETFSKGQAMGVKEYQKMLRSINAQTQKEIRAQEKAKQKIKPKTRLYYPESIPVEDLNR